MRFCRIFFAPLPSTLGLFDDFQWYKANSKYTEMLFVFIYMASLLHI